MFFPFFQPSSDQLVNNAKILHYFKINNKLAFASQICSGCGAYVEKDLSVRMHCSSECGLTVDRDVNAARNVLKRGLGLGLGQADFMPVGEVAATRLGGVGQVVSVIQEAHIFKGG